MSISRAGVLSLVLVLSACGGGSDNTTAAGVQSSVKQPNPGQTTATDTAEPLAFASKDYLFPYQVGDHVVMSEVTSDPTLIAYPETTEITGTLSAEGKTGLVLMQRVDTIVSGAFFVTADADGVIYSTIPTDPSSRPKKYWAYPATLHIGDTVTISDESTTYVETTATGFKYNRVIRYVTTVTVEGLEDVTTKAGTFPNCLRLKQIFTNTESTSATDTAPASVTTLRTDAHAIWYASGIGMVKSKYISDTPSDYELQAYELAGRRNETMAPTATISNLPTQSNHWKFETVTVEFNEFMQHPTLNANAMVITDPTGKAIEGKYKSGPNWVSFTPDMGALSADGLYTLSVNGHAKDWAGNAATSTSWTFRADGLPPAPIRVTPAPDSTGAPIDQPVVLEFAEDIVGNPWVEAYFYDASGQIPLILVNTIRFEKRRMIVAPDQPFERGTTYRLVIGGNHIKDLADNEWGGPTPYTYLFTTAP